MIDSISHVGSIWLKVNNELSGYIHSRIRNEKDADDILHDIFIKIHDNIGSLKERQKLTSWIWQITRNQVTDYFRIKGRDLQAEKAALINPGKSGPSRFMKQAVTDMINMMDELPPGYCEALCLTEIEGMSQKEHALKKGISYSGAKSRVQRARLLLKDMLMKCCHYEFDRYGNVFGIRKNPDCCCCK